MFARCFVCFNAHMGAVVNAHMGAVVNAHMGAVINACGLIPVSNRENKRLQTRSGNLL